MTAYDTYTCTGCGDTKQWNPSRRADAPTRCHTCPREATPMTILPITNPQWFRHPDRACLEPDPELEADRIAEFYELSEGKTAAARAHAKLMVDTYCAICPVKADCLANAINDEGDLTDKYRYGIQGGATPAERASLYRMLQRPIAHGTERGYKAHRRRNETPCTACKAGHRASAAKKVS